MFADCFRKHVRQAAWQHDILSQRMNETGIGCFDSNLVGVAVVFCNKPNTSSELICKYYLEPSSLWGWSFPVRQSWTTLPFKRSKTPFYVARFWEERITYITGRTSVGVIDKTDYLRCGNVKVNAQLLRIQYQEWTTPPQADGVSKLFYAPKGAGIKPDLRNKFRF